MSDSKVNIELLIIGNSIDQRTPEEAAGKRPWNDAEKPHVYRIAVEPGVSFTLGGTSYVLSCETGKVVKSDV